MSRDAIIAKIESLPEESRKQLLAFLNFLAEQSGQLTQSTKPPGFKFNWAGGLADLGQEFTAVELQHKASEWR
jgi:hypothetical protein